MRFATLMPSRTEPSIADQFLGVRKTRAIAHRTQNGHRTQQRDARQLDEIGRLFSPRLADAQPTQLSINGCNLGGNVVEASMSEPSS